MRNVAALAAVSMVLTCFAPSAEAQVYVAQPQPYYYPQAPQQPQQQRVEERARLALLIPGIPLLVAFYVTNVIGGLFAGSCIDLSFGGGGCPTDDTSEWDAFRYTSLVPVLGPWIQLGLFPGSAIDTSGWVTWLVIDGLLQAGGLTLIILSLVFPEQVTVYADNDDGVSIALLPSVGPSSAGAALVGTF